MRRSRTDALRCKHIEANPSALVNTIVVDIDDANAKAMALWGHRGMLPNWIAENPANGHAHAGWVLTYPVPRTDMARLKPLKLLHAVTEGLRRSVDGDEGNRQRLLDMLKAHAAELRAWASDAGVRLPSAESAGELREQVRDLPQEPQIQEQPGYGYQPGFQQPQQWQQQPWN